MSKVSTRQPSALLRPDREASPPSHGLKSFVLNQPVRRKLLGSFALVCLLMIVVGALGLARTSSTNSSLQHLANDNLPGVALIGDVEAGVLQSKIDTRDLAIAQTPATIQAIQARIKTDDAALETALADYQKSGLADPATFDKLKTDIATMQRLRQPALKMAAAINTDLPAFAAYMDQTLVPAGLVVLKDIQTALNFEKAEAAGLAKSATSSYGSARTIVIALLIGAILLAIGIALYLARIITRPLKQNVAVLEGLAQGNLDQTVDVTDRSELGQLGTAVNASIDQVRNVLAELGTMSDAHEAGDIDAVIDTEQFDGGFKTMAEGVNQMVGSHIAVKKRAMAVFKAFGEGDFDATMEQLPGKKAFINDTIESVRGNLRGILAEMGRMSDAHEAGDIDVYINVDQFQGGFKTMAEGVNQMVGSHIAVKKRAMGVFKAFGEGDFDATMEQLPGKKVFINDTIESVRGNLRGIIAEMNTMSDAHEAGDIDIYIDAEKFNGGFKTMAAGVNQMVGSHIAVKKRAMAVVKAFGEGDFDEPMEKLPGKKAFINETIEQVRGNLKTLISDTGTLSKAAVEGRLEVRVDADRHQGGFRAIVQGVNDTLDAVINPLNALIADANMLSQSAIAGELDVRADVSKHSGGFRSVIEGVNNTLDAVIGPVNEVSRVLRAMESGDLTSTITTQYQGQLELLRLAVNNSVAKLSHTVSEVADATDQLSNASSQISNASQSMSQAASEQAATAEETSSSIEQMAASINQNTENAK